MKQLYVLLLLPFLLISMDSDAQCVADAGNDTLVCVDNNGHFTLNLNAGATGGTPPYTYTWETNYEVTSNLTLTASDFLDDTTLASPAVVEPVEDSITFYLTVTDANGVSCKDSVKVVFCSFTFALGTINYTINPGDTVQVFGQAVSNCQPMTYLWSPNYNIADVTAPSPLVWPDTTTTYSLALVDAGGCTSPGGSMTVTVYPAGISDVDLDQMVEVYPNPSDDKVLISCGLEERGELYVYNALGQVVWKESFEKQVELDQNDFSPGVFFFTLKTPSGKASGKFIFLNL
jgi:hypothetical protein